MHRNDALPVKHDIQILFEEVTSLFSSIVDVLPNEIVVDFFWGAFVTKYHYIPTGRTYFK